MSRPIAISADMPLAAMRDHVMPVLRAKIAPDQAKLMSRADVMREAKTSVSEFIAANKLDLNLLDQRDLVSAVTNAYFAESSSSASTFRADSQKNASSAQGISGFGSAGGDTVGDSDNNSAQQAQSSMPQTQLQSQEPSSYEAAPDPYSKNPSRASIEQAKLRLQPIVLDRIDASAAAKLPREDLSRDLTGLIAELLGETKIQLNAAERAELVKQLLDDMLGLGPLEPLLADETISEIMVNGPKRVFIENKGKLVLSDVQFRDNAHVLAIAMRIVTAVGRRIDESTPLCDARLADGSRVNIIIPPLAIDGASITIRKFSKKKITLDTMLKFGSISSNMAKLLRIAGRSRLNILISGGTGSGKTTLLNALSQMIDHGERVVTIEDAAELQLQQPHVVRLETRPPNLEGHGEVTMRDLVKNALRMRPDRIIVGETRGGEALDMLQAMNTGHDGSMSTVHANRPREALMRLENLVGMASANLSPRAIRQQIASAIDMIIQVSRLRDGSRRVTYISEITGMEGDTITMQDLYTCEVTGETPDGRLTVDFRNHGLRPHCLPKAAYFGLDKQLMETMDS